MGYAFTTQMGPFAIIPIWVFDYNLTKTEFYTLVSLRSYCSAERTCWPKIERVAARAKISVGAATHAISKLRKLGLIATQMRKDADGTNQGLVYTISDIDPKSHTKPEEPQATTTCSTEHVDPTSENTTKPQVTAPQKDATIGQPQSDPHAQPSMWTPPGKTPQNTRSQPHAQPSMCLTGRELTSSKRQPPLPPHQRSTGQHQHKSRGEDILKAWKTKYPPFRDIPKAAATMLIGAIDTALNRGISEIQINQAITEKAFGGVGSVARVAAARIQSLTPRTITRHPDGHAFVADSHNRCVRCSLPEANARHAMA